MHRLHVSITCRVVLTFFVAVCVCSTAIAQSVTPTHFEETISPGDAAALDLVVATGATPVPTVDVLFAIDITGSMSGEIDVVQSEAASIMGDIRDLVASSFFGVATFSDYPGTYSYPGYSDAYGESEDSPWDLDQQLTFYTVDVETALDEIETRNGQDWPEDYTRVLWEAMSVDWRTYTKKIVIMFGDAPTHDLDFAGYNFGGDPGGDVVADTADDLDFETVVGQLKDEGVVVLAVYSDDSEQGEATFRGMSEGFDGAEGTGGQFFFLEDAADIPQAIHDMVEEETSTISSLELLITEEYRDWCAVTPASFANVGASQTRNFEITITVPAGQAGGIYTFLIRAVGDGALLGSCIVEVTVPGGPGDLDLGLRPDPDGFSMQNRTGPVYPWASFVQLFGSNNTLHANGDRVYAAEQYFDTLYRNWRDPALDRRPGGLCYGMSACTIINFSVSEQPNAGDYAMPHFADLFEDATWGNSTDAIVFYHTGQKTYNAIEFARRQEADLGRGDAEAYLNEIERFIRAGTPIMFTFAWDRNAGPAFDIVAHAVVPYRVEVDDADADMVYVYVYDSNYPGEVDRRITFDLDANEADTGYTGDRPYAFSIRPLSLTLQAGIGPWDEGAEEGGALAMLLDGPGQLLVTDGVGRRLGFRAGEFFDEIPGALYLPPEVGEAGGGMYFVPYDADIDAELQGTGSGDLTLSAFAAGWFGSVETETDEGSIDDLSLGIGSLSLKLAPGAPKERRTVISHETGDTSRIIIASTAEAGEVTVSLDEEGLATIVNDGSDTTYDLFLEQRGDGKGAAEFEGLSLADGATHFVRVSDWDDLERSEIVVEIDEDSDGDIDSRTTLRGEGGLDASIAAPLEGARVSGTVVIRGTAGGEQFASYCVEVGAGINPSTWADVGISAGPVSSGILAIWDASSLPAGTYTIRLTVEGTGTAGAEASVAVSVEAGTNRGGPLLIAPNPVGRSGTAFYYTLPPGTTSAKLVVLAVSGRVVFETSLDPDGIRFPEGGYWVPTDSDGATLGNGPYVCVLVVDGRPVGQTKMLVQR